MGQRDVYPCIAPRFYHAFLNCNSCYLKYVGISPLPHNRILNSAIRGQRRPVRIVDLRVSDAVRRRATPLVPPNRWTMRGRGGPVPYAGKRVPDVYVPVPQAAPLVPFGRRTISDRGRHLLMLITMCCGRTHGYPLPPVPKCLGWPWLTLLPMP